MARTDNILTTYVTRFLGYRTPDSTIAVLYLFL